MAQILKFQQGGTLTIDGIKFNINDDLVSQYRFLGREFDDDHEKKYYNQFMSTLNKGLSDQSVNIVIDTNEQSISGIDLSGYTDRQQRAIGTNQTDAGKLITHIFRPAVTGAKSAAETLGNFLPGRPKETFKKYSITTPIQLEHKHDENTGEFVVTDGKKMLKDGQDAKINEIKERINFAKNIGNIPVHDLILGYNEESREDIENLIKEIGDLEAFQNRLIDGSYTPEDETRAQTFGIFMDNESSEKRRELQQTHAYETSYQNAGLSPTSWGSIALIGDDGYGTLQEGNGLTTFLNSLNLNSANYFLNNEFFEKYPQFLDLKGNSQNGYFVINNRIYNADNLEALPQTIKPIVEQWVNTKKANKGNPANNIIYDDWFGDSHYEELLEKAYYPELGTNSLFGYDMGNYYNINSPAFAYFDPNDSASYDEYGDPIFQYMYKEGDGFKHENNKPSWARRIDDTTYSSLSNLDSKEYQTFEGDMIAYLGKTDDGYNAFYNKTNNYYFLTDANGYIAFYNSEKKLLKPEKKEKLVQDLHKKFNITSYKKGGTIIKAQNGTKNFWSKFNKSFPTDFALSLGAFALAQSATKKSNAQLRKANELATLHSLPVNAPEIYSIYSENGLAQEAQQAKNKILSPKPLTSDVDRNLGYNLVRDSQAAELDLNVSKTRSQGLDNYKTSVLQAQDQYGKLRTDVENKRRQMIGAMLGQDMQLQASLTEQLGANRQKWINEFRENRDQEIKRRNLYKLQALQANAQGNYTNDLLKEFQLLGGWDNVSAETRTKYNGDPIKYMEGEYADRASYIKNHAFKDIYEYMMNDPYGSTISPLFNKWDLPASKYVPFHDSTGYKDLKWKYEQTPTLNKNGGKLQYIQTLANTQESNKVDLIKLFSKI